MGVAIKVVGATLWDGMKQAAVQYIYCMNL